MNAYGLISVALRVCLLLHINLLLETNAQNFDWLKTFGSSTGREWNFNMVSGQDGSCTFLCVSSTKTNDSIGFGNFVFLLDKTKTYNSFLVNVDSIGTVKKAISIGSFYATDLCSDGKGGLWVSGGFFDTARAKVGDSVLNPQNGRMLIAGFDQNFKLRLLTQFGNNRNNNIVSSLSFSGNSLYFIAYADSVSVIAGNTYSFPNKISSCVFGELNIGNASLIWTKSLFTNVSASNLQVSGIIKLKQKVFITGNFSGSKGTILMYGDTFHKPGSFIARLDTAGNYEKRVELFNNRTVNMNFLASNGHSLFTGGWFTDTMVFNNKKIIPEFNAGSGHMELYAAAYSVNLEPKWFYRPKILNKNPNTNPSRNAIVNGVFNRSFLYLSGIINAKTLIDSNILEPSSNINDLLLMKIDSMGNVLWSVNGKSTNGRAQSLAAGNRKYLYAGGYFESSIQLNNHIDSSKGDYDAWICKINDYSISRGDISKGPYCAGDTLYIPYSVNGNFGPNNVFIAQLSDEFGDFNQNYFELGRLSANKDSVIKGVLPAFKFKTSARYRIRIISSKPAVQSYYKYDTLRFLIYSKDKADPGPGLLICRGDTVNMQTYGGTDWNWSPKYRISSDKDRSVLAWPDTSITYRIIIKDSSGCGITDTAYKRIEVRGKPRPIINNSKDTSLCLGGNVLLKAKFSGGDTATYSWQWYAIPKTGLWTLLKTGKQSVSDSLVYTLPMSVKDSQIIALFLTDECSKVTVTAYYTIRVNSQKADAEISTLDSVLCPGKSIIITGKSSEGRLSGIVWSWYQKNRFGQWVSIGMSGNKLSDTIIYSLPVNSDNKPKQIKAIYNNGCSPVYDTVYIQIKVADTLSVRLPFKDTVLCSGKEQIMIAGGSGGNPNGYKFTWLDSADNSVLSNSDTLKYTFVADKKLKIKLEDGCMPSAAEITAYIKVLDKLESEVFLNGRPANDTVVCHNSIMNLYAQTRGGLNKQLTFKWLSGSSVIGTKDSISLDVRQLSGADTGGILTITFIADDFCSVPADTQSIKVHVLPKLKWNPEYPDSLCYQETGQFKANLSEGKTPYVYRWEAPDGQILSDNNGFNTSHTNPNQSVFNVRFLGSDACSSGIADTISVAMLAPLKLDIVNKDSCAVQSAELKARGSGGKPGANTFSWYADNNFIGQKDSVSLAYINRVQICILQMNNGCGKLADTVRLREKLNLKLSSSNECLGEFTSLKASLNDRGPYRFRWFINSSPTNHTDSIVSIQFSNTLAYKVTCIVSDQTDCFYSDSIQVSIENKPDAAFTFANFGRENNGIRFNFLNRSKHADSWNWDFGNGNNSSLENPVCIYQDTGYNTVTLIAGNKNKCYDTSAIQLFIADKLNFYFPNVFSSDGNQLNDWFGLQNSQINFVQEFKLQIFNRWGEMIFQTMNPVEKWYGYRESAGVYLYKAEIRDIYNVLYEFKGVVELLK